MRSRGSETRHSDCILRMSQFASRFPLTLLVFKAQRERVLGDQDEADQVAEDVRLGTYEQLGSSVMKSPVCE